MSKNFKPLISSKDGSARLTLWKIEHSKLDNKTPILKLIFGCADITHENPIAIELNCKYKLSQGSNLQKIVNVLNFKSSDKENKISNLFKFLKESRGLVFKGKIFLDKSKLWNIDIESICLYIKNGIQIRDFTIKNENSEGLGCPYVYKDENSQSNNWLYRD